MEIGLPPQVYQINYSVYKALRISLAKVVSQSLSVMYVLYLLNY